MIILNVVESKPYLVDNNNNNNNEKLYYDEYGKMKKQLGKSHKIHSTNQIYINTF